MSSLFAAFQPLIVTIVKGGCRMHKKLLCTCVSFALFFSAAFLPGCTVSADVPNETDAADSSGPASENSPADDRAGKKRSTLRDYLIPEASGTVTYGNDNISIDASNTAEGYFMVKYDGEADKVKLQLQAPDGETYTYNLAIGSYEAFPLSAGNGDYHLDVLEHAYDDMYATAYSENIKVTLNDEFRPFLYPNQYVWFTPEYKAVAYAAELSDTSDDLDYISRVYHYVIENIDYDQELAENVQSGYLPNIDNTMDSKKGICFDYASLMAAMLRSQGIPTKLVVGYSGAAYHAWISVYLKESGWVDKIIEFDGRNWSLMDPTLAANNSGSSVKEYIGDGNNYTVKYSY